MELGWFMVAVMASLGHVGEEAGLKLARVGCNNVNSRGCIEGQGCRGGGRESRQRRDRYWGEGDEGGDGRPRLARMTTVVLNSLRRDYG